mgnify:CR=1 FL=1
MISAQDLIEKITSAATCDDCIVVVRDKTQANLRWAGSTLTTNGVIQERSVTVIAFVAVAGGMASGGVTRTDVSLADVPKLLEDAVAAAKAAEAARARAVEVAKTELKSVLSSGKPLTADQLLSADFNGVTTKNIGLINADIAKLPDADKTDLKQIEKVVLKFATVDKLAEGKRVYSSDLIAVGLIPQDSKIKPSTV